MSRIGLEHGRVWVADDGDAVAVWTTPETAGGQKNAKGATDAREATGTANAKGATDVFAETAPQFAELAGDRARRQPRPTPPWRATGPRGPCGSWGWWGSTPRGRGGLGKAVILPGLEAARKAGVPAFLETSDARNVSFYEALGFETTAEYPLPDGGPAPGP
ncbi:N-acetyltransferase [Streptomyces sp. M19]